MSTDVSELQEADAAPPAPPANHGDQGDAMFWAAANEKRRRRRRSTGKARDDEPLRSAWAAVEDPASDRWPPEPPAIEPVQESVPQPTTEPEAGVTDASEPEAAVTEAAPQAAAPSVVEPEVVEPEPVPARPKPAKRRPAKREVFMPESKADATKPEVATPEVATPEVPTPSVQKAQAPARLPDWSLTTQPGPISERDGGDRAQRFSLKRVLGAVFVGSALAATVMLGMIVAPDLLRDRGGPNVSTLSVRAERPVPTSRNFSATISNINDHAVVAACTASVTNPAGTREVAKGRFAVGPIPPQKAVAYDGQLRWVTNKAKMAPGISVGCTPKSA